MDNEEWDLLIKFLEWYQPVDGRTADDIVAEYVIDLGEEASMLPLWTQQALTHED